MEITAAPAPSGATAADGYRLVAAAIRQVTDAAAVPRVDELAAALHVSPSHLRRTFRRWAGVAPKAFLQQVVATDARALLARRCTTLDTATALGLSSTGRLHDLLVAVDGASPGELARLGAGMRIAVGVHDTALGSAVVGVGERGVCALRLYDTAVDLDEAQATVAAEWPAAELVEDVAVTAAVAARLDGALRPDTDQRPRLALRGTNLQLQVWRALLTIPPGRVATYGQLARAVGRPRAARAVANAVARNPVAVLIPCHRVVRASGALAGYRWGPQRKQALLAAEAAAGARSA